MDFYLQKAKLFALETAKRSQEIANQAAKLSQELATETAKRSKELAVDVTKKADQLKAYAGELTPGITAKGPGTPLLPSKEELEEYGITPELREFVRGLTIKTFKDFPAEGADGGFRIESGAQQEGESGTKHDLTPWQERHAVLVLSTVKEISDFRYVLCPRRMNETRFWRIYFTLVNNQIAGYEARATEQVAARTAEKESKLSAQVENVAGQHDSRDWGASTAEQRQGSAEIKEAAEVGDAVKSKNTDHDLDAYLMGVLDSSDDAADGDEDDDAFDADFDQLVNSTADSEGEDEASHGESYNKSKKPDQSVLSPAAKPLAPSEGSSDGELVEIPDSESEQASRMSLAGKSS